MGLLLFSASYSAEYKMKLHNFKRLTRRTGEGCNSAVSDWLTLCREGLQIENSDEGSSDEHPNLSNLEETDQHRRQGLIREVPESTIADLEKEDDEAFRGVVALVQGGELQRPIGVSASLSGSNSGSESQGEHREALTPLFFDPIHMGIDWVPAEAEYRPEDVEILGPASSTPWDPTQYFANSRNDELASAELRGPPIVYCQFRGQRVEIPSTSFSIAKATYGTALCNWTVQMLAAFYNIEPSCLEEERREDHERLVQIWKDIMDSNGYNVRNGLCTILRYLEDLARLSPASQQTQRPEDVPKVLEVSLFCQDMVLGNERLWARCISLHTGLSLVDIIARDPAHFALTQAIQQVEARGG
ncbi:hypothetical protein B0J14DRAFT_638242 [Halenospora varia]|nr:hypothetical protein B0J14DRAFT_638242 [Halenospora varia]